MTRPFSLVVTSFNRPVQLDRLLSYLSRAQVGCPILVADWSLGQVKGQILDIIRRRSGELNLSLFEYENQEHPFVKISKTLANVRSPLVAVLNEDDFLTASGLRACATLLESDPSCSLALGEYYRFAIDAKAADSCQVRLEPTYECGPTDAESVRDRLLDCASKPVEYLSALYRTPALRHNYEAIIRRFFTKGTDGTWESDTGYSRWSWAAILLGLMSSVQGKLARVPIPYCFREDHPGKLTHKELNWHEIIVAPGFHAQYRDFADTLAAEVEAAGVPNAARSVDEAWDVFAAMALTALRVQYAYHKARKDPLWDRVRRSVRYRSTRLRCALLPRLNSDARMLTGLICESARRSLRSTDIAPGEEPQTLKKR